jgi:hypothetical protein
MHLKEVKINKRRKRLPANRVIGCRSKNRKDCECRENAVPVRAEYAVSG